MRNSISAFLRSHSYASFGLKLYVGFAIAAALYHVFDRAIGL